MEIMRTFQSRDFTAALLVSTTMEAVGLMVYQRVVTFRTRQLLMGGASWRVFIPHTEWLREKLGRSEAKAFP